MSVCKYTTLHEPLQPTGMLYFLYKFAALDVPVTWTW